MKQKLSKAVAILCMVVTAFTSTGCTNIIVHEVNKYEQKQLSVDELEDDTYYIKTGTKFVSVYDCEKKTSKIGNKDQLIFLLKDYETVPTSNMKLFV